MFKFKNSANVYSVFVLFPALNHIRKEIPGMETVMKELQTYKPSLRRRMKVAWNILMEREYLVTYRQMTVLLKILKSIKEQAQLRNEVIAFDQACMALEQKMFEDIDWEAETKKLYCELDEVENLIAKIPESKDPEFWFKDHSEITEQETKAENAFFSKCRYCLKDVIMPCRNSRDMEDNSITSIVKGESCFNVLLAIGGAEKGVDYIVNNRAKLLSITPETLLEKRNA